MYGMIHKAIEQLVCTKFGADAWARIMERSGVDSDIFIGNEPYPDEVTYRLIGAAGEEIGLAVPDLLGAFGEHWVLETTRTEYAGMLSAGGRNLREFLINLPNFHARIALIFPKLEPPSFKVSHVEARSLRLHYLTNRPGLAPFVAGILRGLSALFAEPVTVEAIELKDKGAAHDVFLLTWLAADA